MDNFGKTVMKKLEPGTCKQFLKYEFFISIPYLSKQRKNAISKSLKVVNSVRIFLFKKIYIIEI